MDFVELKRISHVISKGTTPTTLGYEFTKSGVPFLRAEDVTNDTVKIRNVAFHISPKTHDLLSRSKLQAGDFLITIAGTLGRVGYVPADSPPLNCNQAVAFARLDTSKVDLKYLFLMCQSSDVMKNLLDGKKVGTIGNLNLEQIGNLQIPLPRRDEQKRIATILDKAHRLHRQRQFGEALSDSFLQSVFIQMFGDPVNNPFNWKECEISKLCESVIDCVNKTAPTVDLRTPYRMIRTSNIKKGEIDLSSARYVTKEIFEKWTRRAIPEKGDVILTREAPLGEVGMLETEKNVFLGQRLVQYRVISSQLNSFYILHAFQAKDLQKQLKRLGAGSTVEHVAVPDCEKLLIKVPPLPLQEKFADIVQKFKRIRRQQREATRQAEHLFRTLLHRAFRGEL